MTVLCGKALPAADRSLAGKGSVTFVGEQHWSKHQFTVQRDHAGVRCCPLYAQVVRTLATSSEKLDDNACGGVARALVLA